MEWYQIVANVLGAIGMILIFVTSAFKSKKLSLAVQSGGHLFLATSDAFASLYSGLAQEVLRMIRDIGIITKKANKAFKIVIIVLILGVGVTVNIISERDRYNVFAYLATLGNLLFTIDIFFNNKKIVGFKIISAVNNVLWMMLFINYQIYTSAIANGAACVINVIVTIWLIIKIKEGKLDNMGNKIITEENSILEKQNNTEKKKATFE